MTSRFLAAALVAAAACGSTAVAQAPADVPDFLLNPRYYSSRTFEKKAIMNGNLVGITFFNYGLLGGVGETRGNWPIGSDNNYVGDVLPIIAAEVPIDLDGDAVADTLVRHVVSTRGPGNRGISQDPNNPSVAWTFEAKPGFASSEVRTRDTNQPNDRVATSTDPQSWPAFWPDEPTWIDPSTGQAQWNGFFGRNQFNADLESFFWADDNNDRELQTRFPNFRPDATRPARGGLGLELKVRGLQWSQFLAQDAIFWLYEVTNSSTTTYPRVAVGLTVGTLSGGDGDTQDDLAFFDQANRIVYSYDNDNRGNQGQAVGYVGYGFLESPGNADNAIDDDGDGDPMTDAGLDVFGFPFVTADVAGTQNTFTSLDFSPRTLAAGDPLVLIDNATGQRTFEYVPASGSITVVSQGQSYTVSAGQTIQETTTQVPTRTAGVFQTLPAKDLIDQDLDGVIDEDISLHFERRAQSFSVPPTIVTLPALKYINYVGYARAIRGRQPTDQDRATFGLLNPMIDEARNDGVDNDGDWSAISDDVGADGQAGTGDAGEGDGVPSPGEPNFDDLDVDESDQVGLSSFYYFVPSNAFPINRDDQVWAAMTPGFFTTNEELTTLQAGGGADGDFIFSSGYFPMPPGETLRFTLALVFGEDLADITTNQITIQEIYDRNYQFSRPPDRPTLRAVPGNGQVTLYWDSKAERSVDPILGMDFEGYRLYRSTDPFFRDVSRVSDAFGNSAIRVPFTIFDLNNGINGVYTTSDPRVRGVPYNLGTDTGLRNSFVDTDVVNGQRYFYGLAAYDRGSPDFYPAENDIPVNVFEDGTITTSTNVAVVTPNAAVSGFVEGGVRDAITRTQGSATGGVFTETLDPRLIEDGATYTVRFDGAVAADSFFVFRDGMRVAGEVFGNAGSVVVDGVRLAFNNDVTRIDRDSTGYQTGNGELSDFSLTLANNAPTRLQGTLVPYDYEIRFLPGTTSQSLGGVRIGEATNAPLAVSKLTNVEVFNTTLNRPAEFVFIETDGSDGVFSASSASGSARTDNVLIYETINGVRVPTYLFRLAPSGLPATFPGRVPSAGDVFLVATRKPFSERDEFRFTTGSSTIDPNAADSEIDRVRVVPNPYVAAASWERDNLQGVTGRGERRIDFIHLPAGARVRIYNVRGALIRELMHDGNIADGTVSWDLRTRENLETAYGVYFYHVEAPDGATKTGRLALIK